MTVINISIPTEIYIEDKKYPIVTIIKTEEIKQYMKKSTVRKNIIKLYVLIWGQLEGDP